MTEPIQKSRQSYLGAEIVFSFFFFFFWGGGGGGGWRVGGGDFF